MCQTAQMILYWAIRLCPLAVDVYFMLKYRFNAFDYCVFCGLLPYAKVRRSTSHTASSRLLKTFFYLAGMKACTVLPLLPGFSAGHIKWAEPFSVRSCAAVFPSGLPEHSPGSQIVAGVQRAHLRQRSYYRHTKYYNSQSRHAETPGVCLQKTWNRTLAFYFYSSYNWRAGHIILRRLKLFYSLA